MTQFSLSVVIPAYNEEQRIDSTLERISVYLRSRSSSSVASRLKTPRAW